MTDSSKIATERGLELPIRVGFPSFRVTVYAIVLLEVALAYGAASLSRLMGRGYFAWVFLGILVGFAILNMRFASTTFIFRPNHVEIRTWGIFSRVLRLRYDEISGVSVLGNVRPQMRISLRTGKELTLGPWEGGFNPTKMRQAIFAICERLRTLSSHGS